MLLKEIQQIEKSLTLVPTQSVTAVKSGAKSVHPECWNADLI